MAENSPSTGRAERASEARTAQEGRAQEARSSGEPVGPTADEKALQEAGKAKTAADKLGAFDWSGEVATPEPARVTDPVVNPYPHYEDMDLDELRSLAQSRNVEIGRGVEKAHLVSLLRAKAPQNPRWDFMPLDELRKACKSEDVEMDPEFEIAHLVTELRAADTYTQ